MQPQNIDREDFNFSKKVTVNVEKQISKIDYSSYKKLAFFAVAIGVFVSAGVYFGNHLVPTLIGSTNIVSTLIPSPEVVQKLNLQVEKLTSQDFEVTNQYYQKIMNMYDNKFDYINKTLLQYNLQTRFSETTVTQKNFKDMSEVINDHKENITKTIDKFNSLKNKIVAKDSLSYHEAQFVLNSVEKAKQHIFFQNTDVEAQFNKNLVSAPKDITKYLMSQNVYEEIKSLDNDIKNSFISNPVITNFSNSTPKM